MIKLDLKHVHRVTAKGKVYVYAWRGGPRILADPSDTVAFIAELQKAHEAHRFGDKSKLAGLIVGYLASDEWTGLSDKTRTNWRPWIDRIKLRFGDLSLASVDRRLMKAVIKKWHRTYKATPRAADMGLQAFSRVLSWGVEESKLDTNQCADIAHLYRNDRSEIIWEPDDFSALREEASDEVMWAAELAALTGLRQTDLLKLSWLHIKANSIEIPTGKSGGRRITLIPIYGELRARLNSIPRRATTVLTNTDAMPWKTGFGSSWQKAIQRAGIDKHFHDLRGTAATRLWMAELSLREIAEIVAVSEGQVERWINIYVRKNDLLRERIRRLDGPVTRTAEGGE